MSINEESKIIARAAQQAFGGESNVIRYWNSTKTKHIDLLLCKDQPYKGITSYSTVGLSQHNQGIVSNSKPLNIEIVGACATDTEFFPNILANCALNLVANQQKYYPGAMIRNAIDFAKSDTPMKHILLSTPFLWEKELKTISLHDKYIAWLLAVPISENEYRYALNNSPDALEDIFEKESIDIFNLCRASVI